MQNPSNRREFVRNCSLALAATSLPLKSKASPEIQTAPKLNLFSKHLQFLGYSEMAKAAKAIGFNGIDLTVRPNGHVHPDKVSSDLPRAVEAIRSQGLEIPMMTTAVEDVDSQTDRTLLETAADLGIQNYRMNWFRYHESLSMPDSLISYQKRIQKLSALNEKLGLIGCYQNHAGTLVGASIWEVWKLLETANPKHFGAQYDIRHATVEGGKSWTNGFRLIKPQIKTIVIKDCKWILDKGRTRLLNTPLGEGMVDFQTYFKLLKTANIDVPFSIHFEYDLGGAEKGRKTTTKSHEFIFDTMRKDIDTFNRLWAEA